jgi:UDP-galactopyranose mutase
MENNPIIVLGAGLAGLSTAYHLKGNGSIYEQDSRVGGLCKSIQKDGFTFDYTGHLLHTNDEYIGTLINQLLGDNLNSFNRSAWIYSNGVYTIYPFQTNLYGLPLKVVKECLLGLIKAKYESRNIAVNNYENWIYKNFGEGIARHFMISYNWKLFTVHPREMDYHWTEGFVPPSTIEDALDGALSREDKMVGYNARFYYPQHGGIEELCKAFAAHLPGIKLKKKAVRIDTKQHAVYFEDGEMARYRHLVSTLPLPELVQMIEHAPAGLAQASARLKYNSVLAICLGVNRPHLTDKHWVYYPEDDFIFYRAGFPMNLANSMSPEGTSSICAEVSYSDNKQVDRSTVIEDVIADLIKAGVLRADDDICLSLVIDIKYAYVIFDHYYQPSRQLIREYLRKHDIYPIGRYGAWEYTSMTQAILQGKLTAMELGQDEKD